MIVSIGDVLLRSEGDYLGLSVRIADRLSTLPGGGWHETAEITTSQGIRDLLNLIAESNVFSRLSENDTVVLCVGVHDARGNMPQGPWFKAYDHLLESTIRSGCGTIVVLIPPNQSKPHGTAASRRWLRRAAEHIKTSANGVVGVQVVDPNTSQGFLPNVWVNDCELTSQGYVDLAIEVVGHIAADNVKTDVPVVVASVPGPAHGVTITMPADRKRWRGA